MHSPHSQYSTVQYSTGHCTVQEVLHAGLGPTRVMLLARTAGGVHTVNINIYKFYICSKI